MFGESNFNGDISEWNVSKVKHMNRTFEDAWEFNQDISNWDVSNVTDITNMFVNARCFD
jgi:surface protein